MLTKVQQFPPLPITKLVFASMAQAAGCWLSGLENYRINSVNSASLRNRCSNIKYLSINEHFLLLCYIYLLFFRRKLEGLSLKCAFRQLASVLFIRITVFERYFHSFQATKEKHDNSSVIVYCSGSHSEPCLLYFQPIVRRNSSMVICFDGWHRTITRS